MKSKNTTNKYPLIILAISLTLLVIVVIGFFHIPMLAMYIGMNLPVDVDDSINMRLSEAVYLDWDGIEYALAGPYGFNSGKILAHAADGWSIYEVAGDEAHNFLFVNNFLSNELLVRKDYQIPQSGQVTAVYVNRGTKVEEYSFCEAMQNIVFNDLVAYSYIAIEDIYHDTYQIQLCYENCPVGTDYIGHVGFINRQWVYIEYTDAFTQNENGMIKVKIIDDNSIPAIEKILLNLYSPM